MILNGLETQFIEHFYFIVRHLNQPPTYLTQYFFDQHKQEPLVMYYYQSLNIIQISKVVMMRSSMSPSRHQVDRSEQVMENKVAAFEKIKKLLTPQFFGSRQIQNQLDLAQRNLESEQWQKRYKEQLLSIYQKRQVIMDQSQSKNNSSLLVMSGQQRQYSMQARSNRTYENQERRVVFQISLYQNRTQRVIVERKQSQKVKDIAKSDMRSGALEEMHNQFQRLIREHTLEISTLKQQGQQDKKVISDLLDKKRGLQYEGQILKNNLRMLQIDRIQTDQRNKTLKKQLDRQYEKNEKQINRINRNWREEQTRVQLERSKIKNQRQNSNQTARFYKQSYQAAQQELSNARTSQSTNERDKIQALSQENIALLYENNTLTEEKAHSQQIVQRLKSQKDILRQDADQNGLLLLQSSQKIQGLQEYVKRLQMNVAIKNQQVIKLRAYISGFERDSFY